MNDEFKRLQKRADAISLAAQRLHRIDNPGVSWKKLTPKEHDVYYARATALVDGEQQ